MEPKLIFAIQRLLACRTTTAIQVCTCTSLFYFKNATSIMSKMKLTSTYIKACHVLRFFFRAFMFPLASKTLGFFLFLYPDMFRNKKKAEISFEW